MASITLDFLGKTRCWAFLSYQIYHSAYSFHNTKYIKLKKYPIYSVTYYQIYSEIYQIQLIKIPNTFTKYIYQIHSFPKCHVYRFAGEVVGALPVAHEPSSFSFSLLILSFAVVAISFIFLDLALCLLKDRGEQ